MMDKAVRILMIMAAAIVICAGCHETADSQAKLTEGRGRQRKVMSLAGQWLFRLDPQNIGEQQKWHKSILTDRIKLPGSVPENGYGDDISIDTKWTGQIVDRSWFTDAKYEKYRQPGSVKIPFWLTPVKHYVGPAWYQKRLDIPKDWTGKRIILFLERCLGILCNPKHPALAQFPTESHSNWQWWDLVTKSRFMVLDKFAPRLRPIVQVIDDWNTNRKLGLLFEAKLGRGKLLVCSIDLRSNLDARPVARQMLYSLLRYMESDNFNPEEASDIKLIRNLLKQ